MALGDGIRRDIATVSESERDRFIAAIVKLDTTKFFSDGVSYWDKQEEIHKDAHGTGVHGGTIFIPWHRALVNHLEELLREVDPQLSLHYWDWTTDPRVASPGRAALFTPQFMGNATGDAGHLLNNFESSEDAETGNGHTKIWRNVGGSDAKPDGTPNIPADATILANGNFQTFRAALTTAHNNVAHDYIGGTIIDPHYSFHDPFVFLLHSNLDRLWAKWQTEVGQAVRLNTATAYTGLTQTEIDDLDTDLVTPWAGGTTLEPWASDPSKRTVVTYTDISIITPPCYDTNQSDFRVLEAENPFNAASSRYQIVFNDVPETETTWRSAIIRVRSCDVATFRIKPGTEAIAPFSVVSILPVSAPHGAMAYVDLKIWFQFTAGAVGTAPQNIAAVNTTIQCVENSQEILFELKANTIHRQTVAVQLALDQSGSMADPAGTSGATRLEVLKDAASLFTNLIQKNNGIGIIRFDQDAYLPSHPTYGGMEITKVNSDLFSDATRLTAGGKIASHGAYGATSIGDGLEMARNQLNGLAIGSYDKKAIIILTDGLQTADKRISEVSGSIDDMTFAVGLGNETQVNTSDLNAIAGSTGGALLLSGILSSSIDDQFRLRKFFLQILAGVTKTNIVSDPTGYINVGTKIKIPFQLCEADIDCRVILLTDYNVVNLSLETPDNQIITPGNAASYGVQFDQTDKVKTSQFGLPVVFQSNKVKSGTWNAILEIDENDFKKEINSFEKREISKRKNSDLINKGAKYCLSVHSFSNLRMETVLNQSGYNPGSTIFIKANLTEYNLPVEKRAKLKAEIMLPDKTITEIVLSETNSGIFTASLVATMTGIYNFRILASGKTYKKTDFTREQILTAGIFHKQDDSSTNGSAGFDKLATIIERCCRKSSIFMLIISMLLLILIFLHLRG